MDLWKKTAQPIHVGDNGPEFLIDRGKSDPPCPQRMLIARGKSCALKGPLAEAFYGKPYLGLNRVSGRIYRDVR